MIGKQTHELNEWSHINNYSDPNNKHKGYIQIWAGPLQTGPNQLVKYYTLEEWEQVTIDHARMTINSPQGTLKLNSNLNYYHTSNPMITASKRGNDSLRGLSNITIDIDNDSRLNSHIQDFNNLMQRMETDLFSQGEIPRPSRITFSGGGSQLSWEIEQCSTQLEHLFRATAKALIETIESWLYVQDDLIMYEVDHVASNSLSGLKRFAGINQKTGNKVKHHFNKEKYIIDDLISILSVNTKRKRQKQKELATAPKVILDAIEHNLIKGRILRLERLQAFRIANNNYKGSRHNLSFLYYNYMYQLDKTNCLHRLYKFNENYPNPLPQNEINGMVNRTDNTIREKGPFKFKQETFELWIKSKGLTDQPLPQAEQQAMTLENNPKRKEDAKHRKIRQEARIKSLLNDPKLTYAEIGKLLDKSPRTIMRYAKRYNIKRDYQASK